MKRWFSPSLVVAVAAAALFHPFSASAADILWKATGSGAWITAANWTGDVMPGSGDVAQFGSSGPVNIGVALWNPNYATKGEGWVGAITLLATRTASDLSINGNANSSSTFYMGGSTIGGIANSILVNESNRNLTLAADTPTYSRQMTVALRSNQDHVVQVLGSGNVTIKAPITGDQARLTITGTGTGSVILSGTNSTYSGGTTLLQGRLTIAANQAAGTGNVTVTSGTFRVNEGVTFNNTVIVNGATGHYERLYSGGGNYNSFKATSQLDEGNLHASILGGSAGEGRTLSAQFRMSASAVNDADRRSGILDFDGTQTDIFVLELRLTEEALTGGSYLSWLDGDEWVNAIEGNSKLGKDAVSGFSGSFALSGAAATEDYLGSWGYDLSTNSVWAILDHNSAFAVAVPEPGSWALLAVGAIAAFRYRIRRKE